MSYLVFSLYIRFNLAAQPGHTWCLQFEVNFKLQWRKSTCVSVVVWFEVQHYTMLDIKYILGHKRTDDKRTRLLCIIQYACKLEKTLSSLVFKEQSSGILCAITQFPELAVNDASPKYGRNLPFTSFLPHQALLSSSFLLIRDWSSDHSNLISTTSEIYLLITPISSQLLLRSSVMERDFRVSAYEGGYNSNIRRT